MTSSIIRWQMIGIEYRSISFNETKTKFDSGIINTAANELETICFLPFGLWNISTCFFLSGWLWKPSIQSDSVNIVKARRCGALSGDRTVNHWLVHLWQHRTRPKMTGGIRRMTEPYAQEGYQHLTLVSSFCCNTLINQRICSLNII